MFGRLVEKLADNGWQNCIPPRRVLRELRLALGKNAVTVRVLHTLHHHTLRGHGLRRCRGGVGSVIRLPNSVVG